MKHLRIIQTLFFVLTVFFITRFLLGNFQALQQLQIKYDCPTLLLAFFFSLLSLFFVVLKNKFVYELELYQIKFSHLWRIICRTNLYRYIPGGIWNHAGLIIDMSHEGKISLRKSTKLQFLNIFTNIYAGFFFLLVVLPGIWRFWFLLFYVLGLLATNQILKIGNWVWNLFNRKRRFEFPKLSLKSLIKIQSANLGFWFFLGLSFVYLLRGINVLKTFNLDLNLYLGSSYIMAWLAGFLFLPAPNGLGVREYVMGLLLARVNVSLTLGISVSLLYRVFILIRDLTVFIISISMRK